MTPLIALAVLGISDPQLRGNGLHGYINATVDDPPESYGYGVSLYSTAWPLLDRPVEGFQIGLASTWILPDNRKFAEPLVPHGTVARDSMPERGPSFWTVFQTIEGGLGFWTSNKFFAPTAKFRMNGSVDGYNHELSTSGWDFYGNPLPGEYMGIAQLSSRLLIPPDGLTLASNTCNQLFGYAWMALPLIASKKEPVATGNQCWTAFLNTKNFKGPIAFYLPSAWSKMSGKYPPAVGRGLDALKGIADSGAIEIGAVPHYMSDKISGSEYAKIPQLNFPTDEKGRTILLHRMTSYSKEALWNDVQSWLDGGTIPQGTFKPAGAFVANLSANPLVVEQGGKEQVRGIENWVKTTALDSKTFGLQWNTKKLKPWQPGVKKALFPSYFRHDGERVTAVEDMNVPKEAGLTKANFPSPDLTRSYVPSESGKGVWKSPGPKAGPFKVTLNDGSVVTYYWYRFIDQPSLQNAGLSSAEKQKLQRVVEEMHRKWTMEREYMAPPKMGKLASLDSAVIVTPPKGLEVGYVPVAYRQDPKGKK